MPTKLPFHEWLIITLLITLMLTLAAVTYLYRKPDLPSLGKPHAVTSQELYVTIKGAVIRPGSYELKKGSLLEDLLALAVPLPEADLRRLKLKSKLRNDQIIKIIARPLITVYLEGAVMQTGPIQIPKGTQICDLKEKIQLSPEADPNYLQKKRLLKDQEVLSVPIRREAFSKKCRKQNL